MKLVELKQLCNKLGLKPIPTKHRLNPDRYEVSVDDCIKSIQEYSVSLLKKKNQFNNNLEFILNIKSPMLANLISKQDKTDINNIWNDSNNEWVLEEKLDGIRCFLSYNSSVNTYNIYSRALDQTTFLPIDYSNEINLTLNKIPFDFILDCELVINNLGHEVIEEILNDPYKKLDQYRPKLVIFDLLKLGTYDITNKPLSFRRQEAFKLVDYLNTNYNTNLEKINERPSTMNKEEYYNYVVQKGLEGIIAKKLNSTYDIKGHRNGDWTKIKKNKYEGYTTLAGDTYDLFITDAVIADNKIIGLELSSYISDTNNEFIYDTYGNRQVKKLGIMYDISDSLRQAISIYNEYNIVRLNSNFLNKVMEVNSSGYNTDTKCLNNLQFICWRMDRTYESCKLKLEDIS